MTEKELFENFQLCFGRMMTPFETEDLRKWVREAEMPVELVNEALREAVLNNATSLKYINRILMRCQQENINSVEKFRQKIEEFERQKQSARTRQSTVDTNVPDWAREENQSKPKELTPEQKAEMQAWKQKAMQEMQEAIAELESLEKG